MNVGVSAGAWGLAEGYSMMAGGKDKAVRYLSPAFETLAPGAEEGWGHVVKRIN